MYGLDNVITEKDAVIITPEVAKNILQKQKELEIVGSTITQRDIDQKKVNVFVNDLKNKEWTFTGDSIKLANNGRLLDGQNRLMAIVQSGVSVPMLVVNSMNESNFTKMDIGKPRNLSDFLKIAKVPYYTVVAYILKNVNLSHVINRMTMIELKTPKEFLNYYYQNTEFIEYMRKIYSKKYVLKKNTNIIQILGLFHNTKYQKIAEDHIDQIFNNVVSDTDSNIFRLRNHIEKIYKQAEKNKLHLRITDFKKLFIASIYKTGQLQKYRPNAEYDFTVKQILPERYKELREMIAKAKKG